MTMKFVPIKVSLPILITSGIIIILSLILCCYLKSLQRKIRVEQGYKVSAYKPKKSNSSEACAICLDDFQPMEKIVVSRCQHSFHNKCLERWLEVKNSCPICLAAIKKITNQDGATITPNCSVVVIASSLTTVGFNTMSSQQAAQSINQVQSDLVLPIITFPSTATAGNNNLFISSDENIYTNIYLPHHLNNNIPNFPKLMYTTNNRVAPKPGQDHFDLLSSNNQSQSTIHKSVPISNYYLRLKNKDNENETPSDTVTNSTTLMNSSKSLKGFQNTASTMNTSSAQEFQGIYPTLAEPTFSQNHNTEGIGKYHNHKSDDEQLLRPYLSPSSFSSSAIILPSPGKGAKVHTCNDPGEIIVSPNLSNPNTLLPGNLNFKEENETFVKGCAKRINNLINFLNTNDPHEVAANEKCNCKSTNITQNCHRCNTSIALDPSVLNNTLSYQINRRVSQPNVLSLSNKWGTTKPHQEITAALFHAKSNSYLSFP